MKFFKIKKMMFYTAFVAVLGAVAAGVVWLKVSSIEASIAPVPAQVDVSAQQLTENLDSRLKFVQSHVTGAAFSVYKIKMKDNLWKIASRKKYSVHSIIGCNPQLKTYDVSIGQKILLPSKGGVLHPVMKSDTWESIAKRYKVDEQGLIKSNSGILKLVPGLFVFVPGGRPDMDLMNEDMRKKYELRALFTSPLGGRLTSTFGKRWHPVTGQRSMHGGIDVAVREGTWVGAAAPGVVTLAATGVGHYGTAVFIQHQNGYETQYGHLSKILVREGQKVKEHQLIAKSGSTGRSTGPHLHFTIKKNGVPLDPLKFLW